MRARVILSADFCIHHTRWGLLYSSTAYDFDSINKRRQKQCGHKLTLYKADKTICSGQPGLLHYYTYS